MRAAHSYQYKKYYINSNNNKCKKVYECLVFIENVFRCSLMSSELKTELNHKRSANFTEILELTS